MKRWKRFFLLSVVFASQLPAAGVAAITYSFDWYCPGCAKIGLGGNGREGPFGSGAACEGARASLAGSLAARGCGARCFNPQPCTSAGQADLPPSPNPVSSPTAAAPAAAEVRPIYDPRAERVRRADEVKPAGEAPRSRDISGRWRNTFSWYQVQASRDGIQIALVETCRKPDCVRREFPNRPVFFGRQEGSRLVGVVPIRRTLESEQAGRRCATPTGEFPVEGRVSEDGKAIVWRAAQIPVGEGCAPVSVSLGTWRRG
jgi:hypothetical protein